MTKRKTVSSSQTILDLAEETQCLKILEDKTHIHSHITSQWNGALDPTTSWYKVRNIDISIFSSKMKICDSCCACQ